MSMSTTSGCVLGIFFSASATVPAVQTHWNPGVRLSSVSNPSRTVLLSSTMPTLIIKIFWQRRAETDGGSLPGVARDVALAIEGFQPVLHIGGPIIAPVMIVRVKTGAIVGNFH